jgi:hypothetical protein
MITENKAKERVKDFMKECGKFWEELHRKELNSFITTFVHECYYDGNDTIHKIFSQTKGDRTSMLSYKLNNIFEHFIYFIKFVGIYGHDLFEKYDIKDWVFENGSGYDTKVIFNDGFELLIEHKSTSNKSNVASHWYSNKVDFYLVIYYTIDDDQKIDKFTTFLVDLEDCKSNWVGAYNENGPVVGWSGLKFKIDDFDKLFLVSGNLTKKKVFVHFE